MPEPRPDATLAELLTSLVTDIPELFRREIRLARAEARDALDLVIAAIRQLALGSAVAVGAIGVLLAAVVSGLTAVFVARGMELALAGSISAGIVAVLAALLAWLLFSRAVRSLRAARSSLDDTVNAIATSAVNVAEKF